MKIKTTIESPSNSRIKDLISIRDRKERDDLWFIEGLKVVETALASGKKVEDIFLTENALSRNRKRVESAHSAGTRITVISERVARRLSDTMTPQGIFATVHCQFQNMTDLKPRGVVPIIDRIQDPGNLGTIIRTADAFGIKNMVLMEGTCSPANQKVIRSSAASVFNVNIGMSSETEFLNWADQNKVKLMVADTSAQKSIKDMAPGKRSAILLGNESSGVSDFLKSRADELFHIPICGKAESLNVAVASAIILYEFSRKIKNP